MGFNVTKKKEISLLSDFVDFKEIYVVNFGNLIIFDLKNLIF